MASIKCRNSLEWWHSKLSHIYTLILEQLHLLQIQVHLTSEFRHWFLCGTVLPAVLQSIKRHSVLISTVPSVHGCILGARSSAIGPIQSVLCNQSSAIGPQWSILCDQPSAFGPLRTILSDWSSVIGLLRSVLSDRSSVIGPLQSAAHRNHWSFPTPKLPHSFWSLPLGLPSLLVYYIWSSLPMSYLSYVSLSSGNSSIPHYSPLQI